MVVDPDIVLDMVVDPDIVLDMVKLVENYDISFVESHSFVHLMMSCKD